MYFQSQFYETVFLTVLSFGSSTRLMDQESQRSVCLSLCSASPCAGLKASANKFFYVDSGSGNPAWVLFLPQLHCIDSAISQSPSKSIPQSWPLQRKAKSNTTAQLQIIGILSSETQMLLCKYKILSQDLKFQVHAVDFHGCGLPKQGREDGSVEDIQERTLSHCIPFQCICFCHSVCHSYHLPVTPAMGALGNWVEELFSTSFCMS